MEMSLKLTDYIFEPLRVEQNESFPFVGDQYNLETEMFSPTDVKKLTIANVTVENEVMTILVLKKMYSTVVRKVSAESIAPYVIRVLQKCISNKGDVIAQSDVNDIQLDEDYGGILVGVTIVMSEKRGTMPSEVRWRISNMSENVQRISFNTEVKPGSFKVTEYYVQKRSSLKKKSTNLNTNFDFISLKEINSSVAQLEELCRSGALEEGMQFLTQFNAHSRIISDELENHVRRNVSNLDSDSWVFISWFLLNQFSTLQDSISKIEGSLHQIKMKASDKNQMIALFHDRGIDYVSSKQNWWKTLQEKRDVCAILLFEKTLREKGNILETFFKLMSEDVEGLHFCVVNMDQILCNVFGSKGRPKDTVIQFYRNGVCTEEDVMNSMYKSRKNLVDCKYEKNGTKPKKRALLKLTCPEHYTGKCPGTIRDWICKICETKLYYTFDNNIYCDLCGEAKITKCEFRCENYSHSSFTPLSKTLIDNLKYLEPLEEKNILILGQSGVGKSTWINSIVNYMFFETLEKAKESEGVIAPIPAQFHITDNNLETRTINVGDFNEKTKTGESVTKECNTYSVVYKNNIVNLIDTPGVGDNRGVDEDRKHLKCILACLRHVDLLHGICLLLKPNETRISVLLTYCLKEILSNLHKSSSNNLLFCFTNARSTFYKPGETMPILITLLKEIGVNLNMKERTFCLDNEAFKFLCCKDTVGITFSESDYNDFASSWKKSVEDTTRLLERVSSLLPHKTDETWSLNRARRIILSLTRPIGDITQIIQTNIEQYNLVKMEIESSKQNLTQLRQYINISQLKLTAKDLGHPRTVCTADKCVRYHTFPNVNERKTEFIQHCHTHCYLKGVQPETYPNPDLLNCWAMNGTKNCRDCSCSWETHMHIYYEQEVVQEQVNDSTVATSIDTAKNEADAKAKILDEIDNKKRQHEEEKDKIVSICVKFASFLRNNAIAGYNDALGDYLHFLISSAQAKKRPTASDEEKTQRMKELLAQYEEEKKLFAQAERNRGCMVTVEDIRKYENELYDLPLYGKQLRQVMTVALAAEDKIAQHNIQTVSTLPNVKNGEAARGMKAKLLAPKQNKFAKFMSSLTSD